MSIFLISAVIIVVLISIIWSGSRFYREFISIQFDRDKILKIERDFILLKEKFEDSSHFFRFSMFVPYKSELEELKKQLEEVRNVFLKKVIKPILRCFFLTGQVSDKASFSKRSLSLYQLKMHTNSKLIV